MAPLTVTGKIIERHRAEPVIGEAGDLALTVDQVLVEDATGTMAALQFEELGAERCATPLAVVYVDHNVLQLDDKNKEDHLFLQAFCRRFGLKYSKPGNGISHYVHLERYARPGGVLVGADSHSSMAGAAGMLAIGVGGLEAAASMAGLPFELSAPRVVGVELHGALPPFVEAKDVVLELLRRYGVRGGTGCIFEFFGPGVGTLGVSERGTIANMVVETGATTAVFPSDERTREWLERQQRGAEFTPLGADEGAAYDAVEAIDLARLEPLVALPSSPGSVVPVAEVEGAELVQVCVGSSVNSSYEDLATVAAMVRGRTIHPAVDLTVTPGSRQILETIVASGVFHELVSAGARILEPICGPCIGAGQAPPAGRASLRTFNRNFPGRSGTVDDRVYLCSPATAAASALTAAITDPRRHGTPPRLAPAPDELPIDDRHVLEPAPAEEADSVAVHRSTNVAPPPACRPPDETLELPVLIVAPDDVSTGDLAPDGAVGMALWGNIPLCARYMFRRLDATFHERALAAGDGLIVAGENYGQGSSREQAALSAVHLGVRAVVAKSFARIHRRNLVLNGVVPLVFADPADYDDTEEGDVWRLDGVRTALESGETVVEAATPRGSFALELGVVRGEEKVLLAGGLRRYLSVRDPVTPQSMRDTRRPSWQ
jgi:aconitate hydratase